MLKRPHKSFLRIESKRGARGLVAALLLAGLSANANADSKLSGVEKKLDDVSQKVEILDRSTSMRFDTLDKVRAAELKALEDKLDVKKDLADVKGNVAANAQKSVDWWLAWLAAFLAIFGIGVPLVLTRDLRAKHKAQIEEIERIRAQVEVAQNSANSAVLNIDSLHERAQTGANAIQEAVRAVRAVPVEAVASHTNPMSRDRTTTATAIDLVAKSNEAPLADRLFAKGVRALQVEDFKSAVTLFAAVVNERADDSKAFVRLAYAFHRLALVAHGPEKRRLLLNAISNYNVSLKFATDDPYTLYNLGLALCKLSDTTSGENRRRLLLEGIEKYDQTLKIQPDHAGARESRAVALGKLSDDAKGDERGRMRHDEISSYQTALEVNPDDPRAHNNLGVAIGKLADVADGDERRRLLAQAASEFEAALEVEPDMTESLTNLSMATLQLARSSLSEADRLRSLHRARETLHHLALLVGQITYDAARVEAMLGDAANFARVSDNLPEDELPSAQQLRADKDLDGIRETPEFQAWWTRKFGNEPLVNPVA